MANNCPFWKNTKCAPTGEPVTHDCSYSKLDFANCAVYKMHKSKAAGGSMEDQLRAAGAISSGTRVVGGHGRFLDDFDEANYYLSKKSLPNPRRKWWQFWK